MGIAPRLFLIVAGCMALFAQSLPRTALFGVILVAVGAGLLAWWIVDRPEEIRRERRAKGQCVRCGYDLTGNVSGVCPECGSGGSLRKECG